MWVQDVRMPVQPQVPVVIRADSGSSTRMETFGVPVGLYDRPAGRRRLRGDADYLTGSDLALIYAVTGESVWQGEVTGERLSPFAGAIAADRRAGRLAPEVDVSAGYLVRTGAVIEANGGANPFSGIELDRAIAYLASRNRGHIDVVC